MRIRTLCAATLLLLLQWGCAASGRSDGREFNGRWNIKAVANERVAWLRLEHAETGEPKGLFVMGTPGDGGGTYKDVSYSIKDGVLRFEVPRDRERRPRPRETYIARLNDGRLEGECSFAGGSKPPVRWVGERPPVIVERDDARWREGDPIDLLNGKNLDGWRGMLPDKDLGWEVKDGILRNASRDANNLVSDQKFWNFILDIEHRLQPRSNSGIGLRGRYEVSVLDDFGRPPFAGGHGALYSRIVPTVNASKPAGEWQGMRVRLVGRQVTVMLNGTTVIERQDIEGLTGFASDANEALPGPITIQGDHGLIEFRKIRITPLIAPAT